MSPITIGLGDRVWELPPLILHPFNERVPTTTLLENSRASLMLSGLLPSDGSDPEELRRRSLKGRYTEIRMLYFLGKDLLRWLSQCMECSEGQAELHEAGVMEQSFAAMLVQAPPEPVKQKLVLWGVVDYASIFSRAIGLNALFATPPDFAVLGEEFLSHYHSYTDHLFQCYLNSETYTAIEARNFSFQLYASGEYSRMLESEWGKESPAE
jgi:hypothetical protein